MNNLMFPASKNFGFSKQQKSYVKSIYKKLQLNKAMFGNLDAIRDTEIDYSWVPQEMFELHLVITDLQAEINMLKVGIIRL